MIACSAALLLAASAVAQYPQNPYQRPYLPGPTAAPPPAPALMMPAPGSAGQVMYFCKPADAQVPLSGSGAGVSATPAADPLASPPLAVAAPAASPIPAAVPQWAAPVIPASSAMPAPASPAEQQPWAPPGHQAMPMPAAPPTMPPAQAPPAAVPAQPGLIPPPPAAPPIPPIPPIAPQPGMAPGTLPVQQPYGGTPGPQAAQPSVPGSPPMMVPPDAKGLTEQYSTTLPPRKDIFNSMMTQEQLEKWVMEKVRLTEPGLKSLQFPEEEKIGAGQKYVAKTAQYPPRQAVIEPTYLVTRRLLFEEKNAERYGWDLGFVQPLVSTMYFYKDFILLPAHLADGFAEGFWDTNAGKCLPGTPTPYMLYPPGLTCSGLITEAAAITGLTLVIP